MAAKKCSKMNIQHPQDLMTTSIHDLVYVSQPHGDAHLVYQGAFLGRELYPTLHGV